MQCLRAYRVRLVSAQGPNFATVSNKLCAISSWQVQACRLGTVTCASSLLTPPPLNCRGFEESAPHIFPSQLNNYSLSEDASSKRSHSSMQNALGDARLSNRCSQASETAPITRERPPYHNWLVSSPQHPSPHATHMAVSRFSPHGDPAILRLSKPLLNSMRLGAAVVVPP
jgi:hypothetical protein